MLTGLGGMIQNFCLTLVCILVRVKLNTECHFWMNEENNVYLFYTSKPNIYILHQRWPHDFYHCKKSYQDQSEQNSVKRCMAKAAQRITVQNYCILLIGVEDFDFFNCKRWWCLLKASGEDNSLRGETLALPHIMSFY